VAISDITCKEILLVLWRTLIKLSNGIRSTQRATLNRGIARGLQGDVDEAIADFKKAKALKPDSIVDKAPEFSFCAPYRELSSYIKFYPEDARGYEVRGILNLLQDREGEAKRILKRA